MTMNLKLSLNEFKEYLEILDERLSSYRQEKSNERIKFPVEIILLVSIGRTAFIYDDSDLLFRWHGFPSIYGDVILNWHSRFRPKMVFFRRASNFCVGISTLL